MLAELKYNDEKDLVKVKLTLGAAHIYQAQFNRDLFTDLYELAVDINESVVDKAIKRLNIKRDDLLSLSEQEITEKILSEIDISEVIANKPMTLEQCERALNVIWAFAKNADEKISLPEKWLDEFELFPTRKYINQLFDKWTAVQNGTIELKNE